MLNPRKNIGRDSGTRIARWSPYDDDLENPARGDPGRPDAGTAGGLRGQCRGAGALALGEFEAATQLIGIKAALAGQGDHRDGGSLRSTLEQPMDGIAHRPVARLESR